METILALEVTNARLVIQFSRGNECTASRRNATLIGHGESHNALEPTITLNESNGELAKVELELQSLQEKLIEVCG